MMLAWMLSVSLFGAFVALAASSTETLVRASGRPTRWIWCATLLVAVVWPLAALMLPPLPSGVATLPTVRVLADGAGILAYSPTEAVSVATRLVMAAWCVASLLLAIRLVRGLVAMRRLHRVAEPRVVDGVPVLVDERLGPATIGLRRHAVLLPRSVLDLEESLRRLVLQHEREHCAARDPWLLLAASLAVVLFPWNAALWFISRRVHLALELDCDARVLASGADPLRYGRLLLMIAQRASSLPLAPTLVAPPSHLERRIMAMRTRLVRQDPVHLAVAGALLIFGLAGACSQGAPDAGGAKTPGVTDATPPSAAVPTAELVQAGDTPAKQIPGIGLLRYPDAMRTANRQGEVIAQFVVDRDGTVDLSSFRVVRSTDPAFTQAVLAGLKTMRFTPARKGGVAVRQMLEQPFTFSLQRS